MYKLEDGRFIVDHDDDPYIDDLITHARYIERTKGAKVIEATLIGIPLFSDEAVWHGDTSPRISFKRSQFPFPVYVKLPDSTEIMYIGG